MANSLAASRANINGHYPSDLRSHVHYMTFPQQKPCFVHWVKCRIDSNDVIVKIGGYNMGESSSRLNNTYWSVTRRDLHAHHSEGTPHECCKLSPPSCTNGCTISANACHTTYRA